MAGFEDFDDRDWRETLAELRLMVAAAGFGEWDSQAAAALDDDFETHPNPRKQLLSYTRSFETFLNVRSASNLQRMSAALGKVLHDEVGRAVTGAVVVDAYDDRTDEVIDGQTSDGILKEVRAFSNEVSGETGYFDGEEIEE